MKQLMNDNYEITPEEMLQMQTGLIRCDKQKELIEDLLHNNKLLSAEVNYLHTEVGRSIDQSESLLKKLTESKSLISLLLKKVSGRDMKEVVAEKVATILIGKTKTKTPIYTPKRSQLQTIAESIEHYA